MVQPMPEATQTTIISADIFDSKRLLRLKGLAGDDQLNKGGKLVFASAESWHQSVRSGDI